MEHIEYFLANDGTRFDDEEECLDYEFRQMLFPLKNDLQFFNSKQEPITSADYLDRICYIIVKTDKALKTMYKIFDYYGIISDNIDRPSVYRYDFDRMKWRNVLAEMNALQSILTNLNYERA